MFNSTILDVVVGVIFSFLGVSLVASAATEVVASLLKWRAATLLTGIKQLLNDPKFDGLALQLYNHGLINPRANGEATDQATLSKTPSYIQPGAFAGAMIDVLQSTAAAAPGAAADLAQGIAQLPDPQLRQVLGGLYERAEGRVDRFQTALATWFDHGMDRVSGTYKRRTQVWSLVLGFLLAAIINVDTFHVAKTLWQQPMIARGISFPPSLDGTQPFAVLDTLGVPVGWNKAMLVELGKDPWSIPAMVFGWFATAVATLFGAPFWFDALQKLTRLRGTGPSPGDQRPAGDQAARPG